MSNQFFNIALILSILTHGVLLAKETNWFGKEATKIIRIPLLMEEAPAPPPPPPSPPKPKKKPKPKKAKPQNLPEKVEKVVQGDGLRTGDLVDAEVGNYDPGPPPQPKPNPKPKVNIRKLTREYLQEIREALAKRKKYPTVAQRMGLRGRVMISFIILPNSDFKKIKIKRSSGQKMLDDAAVETVLALSGKIKRPKLMGRHPLKTSVTLQYHLN